MKTCKTNDSKNSLTVACPACPVPYHSGRSGEEQHKGGNMYGLLYFVRKERANVHVVWLFFDGVSQII